ncbi:condensation domain-containing protein [Nocardia sp. NPDC049149]|uniref:condensation domain-containing protein n=1 Tax=Nocardia sp. NPDC049149 TaxID=3364315 RepID=UPI003710A9C7
MQLLFLEHLSAPPGTLLEWTALAEPGPTPDATPATSNQSIHLASGGPTTWLAATFDVAGPIDESALHTAFSVWLPRHDALHCCFEPPSKDRPAAVHVVHDTDIRLVPRQAVCTSSTEELRAVLGARLDEACSPYSFAPYFLGAVSRDESSTVVCGFDHAVCDAWSITIAVAELDLLYRAACEDGVDGAVAAADRLPEPGSFLSYSTREAAVPAASTGPLIRAWRDFLHAAGNDLPHFPLDLGLPAGSLAPFGCDARPLLGATATDALHRKSRADGYSMFAALLAAVALAAADLGGRTGTDLVFPVHTRREPRHHNTFGWLVSNGPAHIPVAHDFCATARGAEEAIRSGQRLAQVPANRVLAAMGTDLRRTRHDLFSVSYTDYRWLPGGSRSDTSRSVPRNPAQFSRSAPLDDVQMWFTRTDEGLALRTRYPATPTAGALLGEFLDRVTATLSAAISVRV